MSDRPFGDLDLRGLLQVLAERSASREALECERGELVIKAQSMPEGASKDMVLNQIDDRTGSAARLSDDIRLLWEQVARRRAGGEAS